MKPEAIEKIQRRNYVRIDVCLSVSLKIHIEGERVLSIEEINYSTEELEAKAWEVNTKNISGSGAKIITKMHIPEGPNVSLAVQLPKIGTFYILARLKRSELVNPDLGVLGWCSFYRTYENGKG